MKVEKLKTDYVLSGLKPNLPTADVRYMIRILKSVEGVIHEEIKFGFDCIYISLDGYCNQEMRLKQIGESLKSYFE